MSNQEQKEQANSLEWHAENLRLTAFLAPSFQIGEQNWWQDLVGDLPQNEVSKPQTGIKRYDGPFRNNEVEGLLVLTIQSTRIDWQLVPLNSGGSEFPKIGSFVSSIDSFLTLMLSWLENSQSVQRLAFGANLLKFVENPNQSYEKLSEYLPIKLDSDSSDFLYQINRPRKSNIQKFSNLTINRLSQWSITSLFRVELPPNNFSRQYIAEPSQVAISLKLDINTVGEFVDDSTSEELKELFKELVTLGKEIVQEGDVK